MGRTQFPRSYEHIISVENLLEAWNEFIHGKRSRKDVQEFGRNLMDNILALRRDLVSGAYRHSSYQAFNISDPKPRNIHKASVRDRVLHRALYRQLYPVFDRTFFGDSYSCRLEKGTHKAINRLRIFNRQVSSSHLRPVWVLKCDIRKFFASVDQHVLINILQSYISDKDILWLIEKVIESFSSTAAGKGLPLGNLTSQLLVNIYMNEFDQFVKHKLKAKYYIRYADDFVLLSSDRDVLVSLLPRIKDFLRIHLKLELHPDKVSISTLASGVDFLGWVHFPHHRVLRIVTKKRMFRRIQEADGKEEVVQSYLGLLSHGNTHLLQQRVKDLRNPGGAG